MVLIGAAIGLTFAWQSPQFTIRSVEVSGLTGTSPLTEKSVNELAQVPLGRSSLFSLSLGRVQENLLRSSWIKTVTLKKKLPETLAIQIKLREPRAVLQEEGGGMSYVDNEGVPFGPIPLNHVNDFPVLSGFSAQAKQDGSLREAMQFVNRWETSSYFKSVQLSSLSFHPDKGFRALVVYRLHGGSGMGRATLELGSAQSLGLDLTWRTIEPNLAQVLRYLSEKSIPAHQIFVGDGKKIVVRTLSGS